ncbi:uncharacterized protein [Venturia canescens]|nr:uncharacterized protein LOC122413741 isoform X2 [Venturia canescens]
MDAPENLCDFYFGGQKPCLGGIMALDGKTGSTIWTHWTAHAIFNVNCEVDITKDNVKDCLITGRGGILHTVDGSDGTAVWKFKLESKMTSEEGSILDVYDATFMNDVDGDDIGDVIASHTLQSGDLRSSEIILISGKTGSIIRRVDFPRKEELFIAPRPLVHPDGEMLLVLVSSTPKKSGGLYIISYSELIHGHLHLRELYWGLGKGILLPPIFTDITSDGTEDIIIATVNATIMAFNGLTLEHIWNYTVANSEVISIPIPGYYNDDDVPDFMVKHQIGPGYPLYYYTVSTILDGKNGTPILEKSITDTLSGQMSGLSISVDDYGNDWFLYWSSNCLNHEDSHEKYRFLAGQNLLSQSRADLCKLRFNTTLVTRLWALSQHVGPPGQSIYFSEDWKTVEYNNSVDPRLEADKYLSDHSNFDDFTHILNEGLPLVSERSPRVEKIHRKTSSFRHRNNGKDEDETSNYYRKQIVVPAENSEENKDLVYANNPAVADNYQIYKEPKIYNSRRKNVDENWNDQNDWQESEKQYDMMYDEDSGELSRMSDVREQRSDLTGPENAPVNKSEGVKNQYDLNMDYTNGGSNYVKYSPVSSVESGFSLYNDEIVKPEVEKKRRKRPGADATRAKSFGRFTENEDYADIEQIFKRESMRNYFQTKTSKPDKNERDKRSGGDESRKIVKGIQRQPPTGILLPSIAPSTSKTSVDLIFSTYWLPPSEISIILSQRDLDCIKSKRSTKNEYDNENIVGECLAERGVDYKLYQESTSRENVKIPLGQMTVYRLKLECVCPDDMLPGQQCKNISQQQSWPAHLGISANGFFKPPNNRRT